MNISLSTDTDQALLQFDGISITHKDKVLLNNATGTITRQSLIVLCGQSGSGKSLLLSALANQLPHFGQVSLYDHGHILSQHTTESTQWRAKIALLTQTPVMVDGTVLDNLALPFTFKQNKDRNFDQAWCVARLAEFGKPSDFIHQDIANLSGGERQIVHFLRTLQLNPALLLLDEPTAALDDVTARVLWQMVQAWLSADPMRAVLAISHRKDEQVYATQIWQMADGCLAVRT